MTWKCVGVDRMTVSARPEIVSFGRMIVPLNQPRAMAWPGSRGSTCEMLPHSRRIGRLVVDPVLGVDLDADGRAAGQHVLRDLPARRVDRRQCGGRRSSATARTTGAGALPSSGTTGRMRRDGRSGPWKTREVASSGVGQTFGKSAFAIVSRIRWPGSKRHAVESIAIASSTGSPGTSGSGSVNDAAPRRVEHALHDEVRRAVGRDVGEVRREADHLRTRTRGGGSPAAGR